MESTNNEYVDRTCRTTRGKRLTKLLDEEIEQDEIFWNQEALKDEAEDVNYEQELDVADEFDSDFSEDEPDPDEEGANEQDERSAKKRRLLPPGKPSTKKKKKKKVLADIDETPKGDQATPDDPGSPDNVEHERMVRKSTRTAVVVRQAERDAIRAAMQATMKPIKRKKEGEEKRMSQEEMLLEAAQTEIMNLRNLERVLAREEEVKKRAIVHKFVYAGPQTRYISKDGRTYIEFSNGASFRSELSTAPVPSKEKAVCVVTGLPAKYRDPKTGLPYATIEAFRVIRQRLLKDNHGRRKEMAMGNLFDSLSGNGFMVKRKRCLRAHTSVKPRYQNFAFIPPSTAFVDSDSESDSDSDSD